MLYYQEEQRNKRDVTVFECNISSTYAEKGFRWIDTEEGFEFWASVMNRDFNHFFEKYPKSSKTIYPIEITSYQTSDGNTHKTKEEAEKVQKTINFENAILDLENFTDMRCEFLEKIIENREKLREIFKMLD